MSQDDQSMLCTYTNLPKGNQLICINNKKEGKTNQPMVICYISQDITKFEIEMSVL